MISHVVDEPLRTMRDVTARGVRMRVIEAGEGQGPPLVLIHGFLSTHLEFDDTIERFARYFHVIAPDLPGSGDSEKPSPTRYSYGVDAFGEAIADLISAYGLGRAFVVGHGLGGAVGLTVTALHPELVNRLVLVAPLCYPFAARAMFRGPLTPVFGSVIFKQFFGWRAFRAYFREWVYPPHVALPPQVEENFEAFNSPSGRESAHAVLQSMLDTRPTVARITRIRRPTLVTWGRQDRVVPPHHALKLAREIPDARLELFDTGHAPHAERPDDFVQVVRHFCEGKRG